MINERLRILANLAADAGFDVTQDYCSAPDLIIPIREIERMPVGTQLSALQRQALLENLRRLIMRTASAQKAAPSVAVQSRLHRWRHLRSVSREAADAMVAVLGYLEIDVPQYLRGDGDE